MKIHLIKDGEVGVETFTEVLDLLQAISGPLEFSCDKNSRINFDEDDLKDNLIADAKEFENAVKIRPLHSVINESALSLQMNESITRPLKKFKFPFSRRTTNWDTIFDKCNHYRRAKNIPDNEFVILLTEVSNTNNWFASLDEKMPFNGFIHTADWNHYLKCLDSFPIAYQVIALVLQKHMFNNYAEAKASVHFDSIGCLNDMCLEKKDIKLKMRTADICQDCMTKLEGKLTTAEIQHALNILESLRVKMLFSQNFKQSAPLSRLVIDASNKIFLPDFGNIEIKLKPLEKALYFFYLKHPEGVGMSYFRKHRTELIEIYSKLQKDDLSLDLVTKRIEKLIDLTTNSSVEKVARIKATFVKAIGEELAKHYYIQGGNGELKKVGLDRGLVFGL